MNTRIITVGELEKEWRNDNRIADASNLPEEYYSYIKDLYNNDEDIERKSTLKEIHLTAKQFIKAINDQEFNKPVFTVFEEEYRDYGLEV